LYLNVSASFGEMSVWSRECDSFLSGNGSCKYSIHSFLTIQLDEDKISILGCQKDLQPFGPVWIGGKIFSSYW